MSAINQSGWRPEMGPGGEGEARPVLAADTAVVLGDRVLGKPADAAQAEAMLADLSGRTHRVLTAVAVHTADGAEMLLSDMIELLPRDKVVLEILETVSITPEILERCHALHGMGFTLAIDDFIGFRDKRFDPDAMAEELTRGVVHEAYAQPVVFNPEAGDIVAISIPALRQSAATRPSAAVIGMCSVRVTGCVASSAIFSASVNGIVEVNGRMAIACRASARWRLRRRVGRLW